MMRFGMISEASVQHLDTCLAIPSGSRTFSLSFWLHTSILYTTVEADFQFSFFRLPPGQNHEKPLQNSACHFFKNVSKPDFDQVESKKMKIRNRLRQLYKESMCGLRNERSGSRSVMRSLQLVRGCSEMPQKSL